MKTLAVICAVLMMTFFAFIPGVAAEEEDDCTAYIAGIVGTGEYRTDDEEDWQPVELDFCLYVDDQVRTMKDSALALMFDENVEVRVNAFSVFTVKSDDKKGGKPNQLDLKKGETWAKVNKIDGKETTFQIKTPTAQAGVRGTEFNVSVDEEGTTKVNVLDGIVKVFNDLDEVFAEAGMATEILKGEAPLKPFEFDIEEFRNKLDQWKEQISIGEIKEALKEKLEEKKKEVEDGVKSKIKLPRF